MQAGESCATDSRLERKKISRAPTGFTSNRKIGVSKSNIVCALSELRKGIDWKDYEFKNYKSALVCMVVRTTRLLGWAHYVEQLKIWYIYTKIPMILYYVVLESRLYKKRNNYSDM